MNCRLHTRLALALTAFLTLAFSIPLVVTGEEEKSHSPRAAAAKQTNPRLKTFMRKKLVASEQIIEGLATADYTLIRKGATTMIHMSKEAVWETRGGVIYAHDSANFVRSSERLIKLANAQDLEGAAHTFAHLTVQCVDCHRQVRSEKIVRLPAEVPDLARRK